MSILSPTKVVFSGTGTLGSFLGSLLGGLLPSNVIVEIPSGHSPVVADADATVAGLQVDAGTVLNIAGADTLLSTLGGVDLKGGTTTVGPGATLDVGTDLNSISRGVLSLTNGAVDVAGTVNNTLGTIQVNGVNALLAGTDLINGIGSTIGLGGAGAIDLSGNINNHGTIQTTNAAGGTITARNLFNDGTIRSGIAGASLNISVTEKAINQGSGVITAVNGGTINVLQGTFTNSATVSASSGGAVRLTGSGVSVTNLQDGALTDGTWTVSGDSDITVNGGSITRLAASVRLSGAGSTFATTSGGVTTALDASLTTIAATGALRLVGNRGYSTANHLTLGGILELGGGNLVAGGISGIVGSTFSGNGVVRSAFASNGRVAASSALHSLVFTGDTALSGVVSGIGTVDFRRGAVRLNDGTTLASAGLRVSGASVTAGGDLTYKGAFGMSSGVLSLEGSTLTLTGATTLSGGSVSGGALTLKGATTIENTLTVAGRARLTNTGSVLQTGAIVLGGAGDSGTLVNASGGSYGLADGTSIAAATGGTGMFSNSGSVVKASGAGTSMIGSALTNSGTVSVSAGTLEVQGSVAALGSATGMFAINNDAKLAFEGAVSSDQAISFGSGGDAGNGSLLLADARSFKGTVAGFVAGDTIDLGGFSTAGSKAYYTADTAGGGGTLKVVSGSDRTQFHLDGAFIASAFTLTSDGHGGTSLSYALPTQQSVPHLAAAA